MGLFDGKNGSSVINAVSSVGSGLIGLYGAKKQRDFETAEAEKQRQWSESQVANQNAWNYRMWQEQNEYNSPASQKQRLQEAGLNPLFYGLDGTSAEGLTSAEPLGYDRASASSFANPVQAGLDAAIKTAQISNIQANTAKTGEETENEIRRREKIDAEVATEKQRLENMRADKSLTEKQTRHIDKQLEWFDRISEANLAKTESETKLNQSQKKEIDELLEGKMLLQAKTLEDFDKRWAKIKAECALLAKKYQIAVLDIENYALNHASGGFMGTGMSLQNLIRVIKGYDIISGEPSDSDVATADATANIVDNKY